VQALHGHETENQEAAKDGGANDPLRHQSNEWRSPKTLGGSFEPKERRTEDVRFAEYVECNDNSIKELHDNSAVKAECLTWMVMRRQTWLHLQLHSRVHLLIV
jgi:hypothetical protein